VKGKWWTLIAVMASMFILLLDITIVNVALPNIQKQSHASLSDLQWGNRRVRTDPRGGAPDDRRIRRPVGPKGTARLARASIRESLLTTWGPPP
jgi:hypothetical protein